MSTDPERAPNDDAPASQLPEGDDPLVARLRTLRWPSVDDEARERALDEFRRLVAEREDGKPADV